MGPGSGSRDALDAAPAAPAGMRVSVPGMDGGMPIDPGMDGGIPIDPGTPVPIAPGIIPVGIAGVAIPWLDPGGIIMPPGPRPSAAACAACDACIWISAAACVSAAALCDISRISRSTAARSSLSRSCAFLSSVHRRSSSVSMATLWVSKSALSAWRVRYTSSICDASRAMVSRETSRSAATSARTCATARPMSSTKALTTRSTCSMAATSRAPPAETLGGPYISPPSLELAICCCGCG